MSIISASDVLSSYMITNKVSQRVLARRIGKTQAYVSKLLDRQLFMSPKSAKRIEEVTGLSSRTLLLLDIDYQLSLLD